MSFLQWVVSLWKRDARNVRRIDATMREHPAAEAVAVAAFVVLAACAVGFEPMSAVIVVLVYAAVAATAVLVR